MTSSCVVGAGTWSHRREVQGFGCTTHKLSSGITRLDHLLDMFVQHTGTRVWVLMSGTFTTSSCVIGAWNHRREVQGFESTTHQLSSMISRLDHLLDMLVQHTRLGNDVVDVHDLLLRRRRGHLEPPS